MSPGKQLARWEENGESQRGERLRLSGFSGRKSGRRGRRGTRRFLFKGARVEPIKPRSPPHSQSGGRQSVRLANHELLWLPRKQPAGTALSPIEEVYAMCRPGSTMFPATSAKKDGKHRLIDKKQTKARKQPACPVRSAVRVSLESRSRGKISSRLPCRNSSG
ncbi:predicted protein [Coccidioides posadasii str. Silveira]|uniref:Predicted protein n=1 Tax=Coccidioides posadasii (strain RMSCC 757 / Silveira) TaxID=443226 RepID=E9DAY3_COCPS|nr:predicted protein [Coccidioides posadasii str. Silveira]